MKYKILLVLLVFNGFTGIIGSSTYITRSITAQDESLDLREANVIGAEFEKQNANIYNFDVTLYHDDDGEEGYADWWQVETLDGELLGRRDLTHAHGTQPFTRSHRITIPEGVLFVVIRGHDQTHGYGGQALVVNLETGAMEKVQQGSEPNNFSGYLSSESSETSRIVPEFTSIITIVGATLVLVEVLARHYRNNT